MGLIGGMSWRSTERYFQHLNKRVERVRGDYASAPLLIDNLDFRTLARLSHVDDWERAGQLLEVSARWLASAGAGAIMICANSMHRVYDRVAAAVDVPVLHIADAVGRKMCADGVKRAALLGSRNVMTEDWYRVRLEICGIELSKPDLDRADAVDRILYDELMKGEARRDSEREVKTMLFNLAKTGVDAVVLGATELEMIVDPKANVLPIYDSTAIHAQAGVDWLLAEDGIAPSPS